MGSSLSLAAAVVYYARLNEVLKKDNQDLKISCRENTLAGIKIDRKTGLCKNQNDSLTSLSIS